MDFRDRPCPVRPYEPPPKILDDPYCVDVPGNSIKKSNKSNSLLIKRVLNEDRLVKELHAQEAALTAENPRIREQSDTINICQELKEHKHNAVVEEKRRIQLQENSHELRKLKKQVNAAYTTMYQAKAAEADFQKRSHAFEDRKKASLETRARVLKEQELQNQNNVEEDRQKAQFRCDMLEQMAYSQSKRQLEIEEKMQDRKIMLQQLKEYNSDSQEERKKSLEHKIESQKIIDAYLNDRKLLKLKAREEMILQNQQTDAIQKELEQRNQAFKDEKVRAWQQKMAICEAMGTKLHKINQEKLDRENRLCDLLVDEKNAKENINTKNNNESLQLLRQQNLEGCMQYNYSRLRAQEEQKLENERLCLERLNLLNKMKQENEEEKSICHQKKKELRNEIQYLIWEKQQRNVCLQSEDRDFDNMLAEMERKNDRDIQMERLRILKAEPKEIFKYMNTSVLSQDELVEFGLIGCKNKE